jgi:general secretion pathway protein C
VGDDEPAESGGRCSFGRVALIVAADDPRYAFASIAGADGKPKMRWVGDEVDGHRVASMTWDRVVLEKGATRCHLSVGEGKAAAAAPEPPSEPDDLTSKIRKVSDTEFEIDRAAAQALLAEERHLENAARMRPVKEGDQIVGLHLSRVRPGTLFAAIGLKNGDRLESINGVSMTDPVEAFEGYRKLETSGSLRVEIRRAGQPLTIAVQVK